MTMVVGVVEEVTSFDSSAGTLYGIVVNGTKYGTYKTKPACSRGDTVSFRFKVNGQYNNVDMKSLQVQAGVPQVETVLGSVSVPGPRKPYVDNQPIIARQSALNSSAAFVALLVSADALPGIKKTSTPEDKYAVIEAIFNEKADEFYRASMAGVAPGGEMPPDTGTEEVKARAAADTSWT